MTDQTKNLDGNFTYFKNIYRYRFGEPSRPTISTRFVRLYDCKIFNLERKASNSKTKYIGTLRRARLGVASGDVCPNCHL